MSDKMYTIMSTSRGIAFDLVMNDKYVNTEVRSEVADSEL
jgi:hypothetical protein